MTGKTGVSNFIFDKSKTYNEFKFEWVRLSKFESDVIAICSFFSFGKFSFARDFIMFF
jgi:hypothetical protein